MEAEGIHATERVLHAVTEGVEPARADLATAVRFLLEELAWSRPGRTVEVRVPPFGAVQCIDGPTHTRGTPPNTIEMAPLVWVQLATGKMTWKAALRSHEVAASGTRATLEGVLPLVSAH